MTEQFKIKNSDGSFFGLEEYWLKLHTTKEFANKIP